jgi:hypothetical protein
MEDNPYESPVTRQGQNDQSESLHLYFLSWRIFVASLLVALLAAVVLYIGLAAIGLGHGDSTLWYCGLFLAFLSWLLFGTTSALAVASGFRSGYVGWWILLSGPIFLALTLAGLWALGLIVV